MKKWIATCSLIVLALLTACSSTNSGTSPQTGDAKGADAIAKKPVELKVWGRIGSIGEPIKAMIEEFQKEYPYITVNYSYTNASQYPNMLQAALSGNDLPDIFTSFTTFPTSQLVELGAIRPLNEIIPENERDQYIPGIWSEGTTMMNGNLYGIPLFDPRSAAMVMFYNKDALQKNGLTDKDIPKTWDELLEFGKKVQTASGGKTYGLAIGVKSFTWFPSVVAQMATAISPDVSTDILTSQFNYKTGQFQLDAPGNIQTIEYFKKLLDEKVLHPNSLVMSYREGTSLMEAGQAVLTIDSYSYASVLKPEQWSNIGVAPIPTIDGKPAYFSFLGGSDSNFLVSKSTKHYDEVKLFLAYMKDHLYPKIIKSGYSYSPIVKQNEDTVPDSPVSQQALKIKDGLVKLVPVPADKNAATIKVATEMSGKLPKVTLESVIEGYFSGQIKDLKGTLSQVTGEVNTLFVNSIKKVQQGGAKVTQDDYKFSDWNAADNYKTRK